MARWDPQDFVGRHLKPLSQRHAWLAARQDRGEQHPVMNRTLRELDSIMATFEAVADVERPAASGRGRRVWVVAQMRAFLEQWQREARDDLETFVTTTRMALAEREVKFDDDRLLTPEEYGESKRADERKYVSWTNSIANVFYKEWHTTGLIIAKLQ